MPNEVNPPELPQPDEIGLSTETKIMTLVSSGAAVGMITSETPLPYWAKAGIALGTSYLTLRGLEYAVKRTLNKLDENNPETGQQG